MPDSRLGRRYDVDWLRIIATFTLFPFHVGKVFDVPPFYHIKNPELSQGMEFLTGFIHLWHMPLFFLLAGWAVYRSLSARNTGGFLRERMRRILVPFLAGTLLMGPPLKYIELRVLSANGFRESFLHYLPTFLSGWDRFTWSHLWFLIYLLTFTLLYLPLLLALTRTTLSAIAVRPWLVYLPLLPLAVSEVALRAHYPGYQNLFSDWANFAYYSMYFLIGYLLSRYAEIERMVQKEWKRALLIGCLAAAGLAGPDQPYALERILSVIAGYCLVLAFLGLGARYLNFTSHTHRYLTEAAFPVYFLHQVAIVLPGYYLIRLPLGIGPKYFLLLAVSFTLTMAVYHLVVRPFRFPRLLCGMKAGPRAHLPQDSPVSSR